MQNDFLDDAIYCLRRASRALRSSMDRDNFYDAITYFAFGMEKLFKAIVHDVNPVFLLEGAGFENAVGLSPRRFFVGRIYSAQTLGRDQRARNSTINLSPLRQSVQLPERKTQQNR